MNTYIVGYFCNPMDEVDLDHTIEELEGLGPLFSDDIKKMSASEKGSAIDAISKWLEDHDEITPGDLVIYSDSKNVIVVSLDKALENDSDVKDIYERLKSNEQYYRCTITTYPGKTLEVVS